MKKKIIYLSLTLLFGSIVFYLSYYSSSNSPLNSKETPTSIKFEYISIKKLNQDKPSVYDIHQNYPKITPELLEYSYGISLNNYSLLRVGLKEFGEQGYVKKIEEELSKRNTSLKAHQIRMQRAFNRLNGTFENLEIPDEIVFANSNFSFNASCYLNSIIVGLERYIGGNHPIIKETLNPKDFPEWIKNGMNERFMDRDVISAWVSTHLFKETNGYHITEMIRWGKVHVITEMCLRIDNKDISPDEVLRWSKEQYDWAVKNEKKFYKYLMDENLLFDSNEKNRAYLLNNGPYTIGLPDESPDRMGQFLGYQIVRNYVLDQNIALDELPNLKYNTILKSYQP